MIRILENISKHTLLEVASCKLNSYNFNIKIEQKENVWKLKFGIAAKHRFDYISDRCQIKYCVRVFRRIHLFMFAQMDKFTNRR